MSFRGAQRRKILRCNDANNSVYCHKSHSYCAFANRAENLCYHLTLAVYIIRHFHKIVCLIIFNHSTLSLPKL